MRDGLAESLLARVMEWEPDEVARERPLLQAFADYKYDDYEQFRPGMRFIESLARWLNQFPSKQARDTAYTFLRNRLIYISRPEINHLVASVYPDLVRPRLIHRAARDRDIAPHRVAEVKRHSDLAIRQRSCLFVGLSDGARTDVLRRSAPRISNEQVVADYHSLSVRGPDLLKELRQGLQPYLGTETEDAQFSTLVLLDDFSASGISYLRDEDGVRKGKIAKLATELAKLDGLLSADLEVLIVLYVATDKALEHLEAQLPSLTAAVPGSWTIHRLQALPDEVGITKGEVPELDPLVDALYEDAINTRHMAKGGTDGRYGFADCGLPVVLSHNTPNNSLPLIWFEGDEANALFPRVSRHREEP